MKFAVVIMERESGKVVESISCGSQRSAERVEDGVNINLNHDKYYTEIIEVEE